jgi:hypothetical protein
MTVGRVRESSGVTDVTGDRIGRDGKSYSIRQRVTDGCIHVTYFTDAPAEHGLMSAFHHLILSAI